MYKSVQSSIAYNRTIVQRTFVSFPLLYNKWTQITWLKITPIYYFIVSVGQKSVLGLAEFSAQGIIRLESRCWPGCVCSLLELSVLFQACVVGRIQLLAVVDLRSPFSYWLLAGSFSQLLWLPVVPCSMAFSWFESLWPSLRAHLNRSGPLMNISII